MEVMRKMVSASWIINTKGKCQFFQPTGTFCCYDNRMQSILLKGNTTIWWRKKWSTLNIIHLNIILDSQKPVVYWKWCRFFWFLKRYNYEKSHAEGSMQMYFNESFLSLPFPWILLKLKGPQPLIGPSGIEPAIGTK